MTFIDKATEVGFKISGQRHLSAVKDGFISLMPLILVGSVALIVKNLPVVLPESIRFTWPSAVVSWCDMVWWGTFAFLALFGCFSIAFHLAKTYNADEFRTGFVALACYFALIPQSAEINGGGTWGWINWSNTSASSLFMAIIVPLIASELFIRFNKNEKLLIKLPGSVPPGVGKSFSVLIPAGLTVTIFVVAAIILKAITGLDPFAAINFLFGHVVRAADNLGSGIFIVFLNQLFWILGLHGPSIVGSVLEPLNVTMMTTNMQAYESVANGSMPYDVKNFHIMTKAFLDTFVYLGGSGATLGLLISIFVVGKSKLYRSLAKGCIVPGCFEINEPVIFGLPIVLNPVLAIPFIIAPIVILTLSYIAISAGIVRTVVYLVPWATPPIISGFAATGGDIKAVILQLINIAISIVIYMPFVKIVDRMEAAKEGGK